MKTYLVNGLMTNERNLLDENEFYGIQVIDDIRLSDAVYYSGDSIKYDLDSALSDLRDLFRTRLFNDVETYFKEASRLPLWIDEVGYNSDIMTSAVEFNELLQSLKDSIVFKHMYLADCLFLIAAIQNLLNAMETAFISYYQLLPAEKVDELRQEFTEDEAVLVLTSSHSIQVANIVETYFTKMYSILDLICKVCFELQNMRTEFDAYKKLKCADILWGDRKRIEIRDASGTIFEGCELLTNIESIRNEIVHNGTWELTPKIFIKVKNGEEVERYMLFPDMNEGRLAAVKNRKHFFHDEIKVNNILPQYHKEFKMRLLATINKLKNQYSQTVE